MSRVFVRRCCSSANAAVQSKTSQDAFQWSVHSLRNGAIRMAVSPIDRFNAKYAGGPAQVTVVLPAGSRYEDFSRGEQGLSHLLRRSVGLSTAGATGLAIVRSLQQMGASLECTASREHLVFSLRVPQQRWLAEGLKYVDMTATQCHYYNWELIRVAYKQMHVDQAIYKRRQFDFMLSELLHAAAFRGQDLSHSLIAPEYALLHYHPEDMSHHTVERPLCYQECYKEEDILGFVKRRIHKQPATIVVTGVDEKCATEIHQQIDSGELFSAVSGNLGSSPKSTTQAKFYSGDQRYDMPLLDMGMVALGWPIPGIGHPDQVALGVLLRGLTGGTGAHPRVLWGGFRGGVLWDALQADSSLPAMAVGGLHWAYSDQGLFGVQLNGFNKNGGLSSALHVVAKRLKQVSQEGLKEQDVNKAKAAYRTDILFDSETSNAAAARVGDELSLTGSISNIDQTLTNIDKLTVEDIKRVAGQVFGRLPAMAAVGDISGLPYADQLARSL